MWGKCPRHERSKNVHIYKYLAMNLLAGKFNLWNEVGCSYLGHFFPFLLLDLRFLWGRLGAAIKCDYLWHWTILTQSRAVPNVFYWFSPKVAREKSNPRLARHDAQVWNAERQNVEKQNEWNVELYNLRAVIFKNSVGANSRLHMSWVRRREQSQI
jgi:hypothetical protein